jgi:flagellar biosynthesis chaperone FliJ
MLEPQASPPERDILNNLITKLDQTYHPGGHAQSMLNAVLQGVREQWPELTRGELYLREERGLYHRRAAFGLPPDLPPNPEANSPAVRALIENKPVYSETQPGTAGWAFPLPRGEQVIGVLQFEGPAGNPTLDTLALALAALVPVLTHTIQQLSAITHQDEELFSQTANTLKEVLQAAQQRAAYQEALSKITAHLQQQTDLSLILQQTLHELSQVLGARRARVRLQVLPPGTGNLRIPSR